MGIRVRDIEVGKRIGESSKFRIYLGNKDGIGPVILKIAKTFEDGDILAEEAGKFNIMRAFGDQVAVLEQEHSGTNSHYDWLFAKLEASFLEGSQGDRRINVFTAPDANLDDLVPLPKLKAEAEIDARSSVWILGRLFKLYSFFELMAIDGDEPVTRYPLFSPGDYLIGPKRHRVVYYNYSGEMADVMAHDFVKAITKLFLDWVVVDDTSPEQEYLNLLQDLSTSGRASFEDAHRDLYQLVEKLWGIQYYPFTYRDRNTITWKTIKEG